MNAPLLLLSWQRFWAAIGAVGDGMAQHAYLLSRYSEPWRRYHTVEHLTECLSLFDDAIDLASQPAQVEAAIWFHDAVYDLAGSRNEENSALLAQSILSEAKVSTSVIDRISELIMATKHHTVPVDNDAKLLVDIDLAILGSVPERFSVYEQQIKAEYSFVPTAEFNEKRSQILTSFLNRSRLYHTDFFFTRLENQARSNIQNALKIPE
jgi:predicted metal-dependent HD superfamily phosphohydrolase